MYSRLLPKTKSIRYFSSIKSTGTVGPPQPHNTLEHLKTRSLISVDGKDAAPLLQGLITNDIFHMPPNKMGSLYAMFLNLKGRVICDSLIYSMGDPDSFIVECDSQISDLLFKHLKMYKLKKAVDIQQMDSHKVFALYDPRDALFNTDVNEPKLPMPQVLQCPKDPLSNATTGKVIKDMNVFCDPRLPDLGYRIITPKLDVVHDELLVENVNPPSDGRNYRWLRYNLGVGEGVTDIPPQATFPLEANCDYLNGINFHKGCYLGQELTARTYHTGKIRKRLMPLFFKENVAEPPTETLLYAERQQMLGKLRGVQCDAGLALLRMHLVVDIQLPVGNTVAITKIPHWWPKHKTAQLQIEITEKNNL